MTVSLNVEMGALLEVPIYESHTRGTNWVATIKKDPSAPGGLARVFWTRAKGKYHCFVPAGLEVGTAIECAADYTSGGGKKSRRRWYGFITEVGGDHITVQKSEDPDAAFSEGQAFALAQSAPVDPFEVWWGQFSANLDPDPTVIDRMRAVAREAWEVARRS